MSEQNEAENQITQEDTSIDDTEQLRQNLISCEDKLKRSLADYINLERRTKTDIQNGINEKLDRFMLQFLTVYDDLIRAKEVLIKENPDAQGLDGILKNINSLLTEYGITPINAVGEIFDPNLHEAIAITLDDSLDDNTITKELRKGYISHNRTLRPTLVEISKKSQ
ncbi:MAG: nucleotide exchange factor GrpE [Candidatus Nitrosotenuis sp.]